MTDKDAETGAQEVQPQADPSRPSAPSGDLPDWRDLLEQRRFNAAKKAYIISRYASGGTLTPPDPEGDDDATRAALTALADIEDLLRERRYKKAIERLSRLANRPAIAPWHDLEADLETLSLAGAALDKRDAEQALTQLEPLTATWFNAEAHTLAGTAHIYLGEMEAAKASFEHALALDDAHYRAMTNLGNLALEEGDIDAAIGFYERALKVNDEFANAHHNLGVALRRKGQVAKSVRQLRRAQRLSSRQDAADARESFTGGLKNRRAGSMLKWVLWVAIGAAVWWVLRSQGVI